MPEGGLEGLLLLVVVAECRLEGLLLVVVTERRLEGLGVRIRDIGR